MGPQAEHRKLALRTLYTVNNSQYILARSPVRVPVFAIPNHQEFASVSLRKCLEAVSVSSPELCQDSSRDFSIYVLDPLESRAAPVPTPSLSGSPTTGNSQKMTSGVAVGLGLMSWAFLADEQDSVMVTGTLTKTSTGEDALEVIFSLIETHHITRAALPATMRAWGAPQSMPPPPPPSETVHRSDTQSKRGRSSSARPSKSLADTEETNTKSHKPSSSTHVERQAMSSPSRKRTLSQMMEELPGTYIGPPAKKAGRPPITGGLASRLRLSENTAATLSSAPPAKSSSTTKDLSSLLALLPPEHNQAIIAALATIDADDNSNASSSNVNKGKCRENPQLLNAIAHLVQVSRGMTEPASSPARLQVKTQPDDDEIVLLDKENVNPGAFKRSSGFFKSDDVTDGPTPEPASAPANAPSLPPPSASTSTPLTPRQFKRSHSLVDAEASASLSAPAFAFSTSTNVISKKPLSPKKTTPTKNQSMTLSSIYTRFVQSSPITPSNINFHPIPGSSCPKPCRTTLPTAITTSSTVAPSSSGTTFTFRKVSTPASANTGANASTTTNLVSAAKRVVYKKPEWAKTDTEMKPRMAEWVVAKTREEEEASRLKRTQRKEEAKKEKQLREKEARKRRRESTGSSTIENLAPPPPPPSAVAHPPSTPPRRRVSTDFLPALPSDDNSFAYFRSPIAKRSERRPPSTPRTRAAPVTPPPRTPRRRSSGMSSGGTRIGSSLFTPKTPTPRITSTVAKARFASGSNNNSRKQDRQRKGANDDLDNIFASPSPTKRHHSTTSLLPHEPETPSKRGRVSPQTRMLSNKSPGRSSRAASAAAAAAVFSSDELEADGAETEEEPSSSLPFLTSDAVFDEPESMTHWSVGLPPSSPPPISSPSLTPSQLESEAELEMMLDPGLDAGTDADADADDATVATPATTTSGTSNYTAENTPASDIDCNESENVLDSSPTSVGDGEDTSGTEDGPELSPSSLQQERRREEEEAVLDLAAFSDLFATQSSTLSSPPLILDDTKGFSGSTEAPGMSLTLPSCDFDFSFALPSTSVSMDPVNMFPDLDFAQFWASVGPLDRVATLIGSGGDDGGSTDEHDGSLVGSTPTTAEVDTTKIAEQMRTLFSGCLM